MNNCNICNDRGIQENGLKCSCVLKSELMSYLPTNVRGIKYSDYTIKNPDNLDKIGNVLMVHNRQEYLSRVKTFLSLKYITTGGKFTYQIHTGTTLIDCYVTDGIVSMHNNIDLLIIELGHDPQNKALPSVLDYIIHQRNTDNEMYTWVYIPVNLVDTISRTYGKEVEKLIFDSKIFTRIGK